MMIAVADAVFIDHFTVCAQVQVLGKLAQKFVETGNPMEPSTNTGADGPGY
jgi:hypothetical protein